MELLDRDEGVKNYLTIIIRIKTELKNSSKMLETIKTDIEDSGLKNIITRIKNSMDESKNRVNK